MAHIHELFDFTVSAFLVHDNKVLLQHHIKIGMWLQPGGHIELDEDPIAALHREIEEETGLTPADYTIVTVFKNQRAPKLNKNGDRVMPLPFDFNVHGFGGAHRHIDICYLANAKTDKVRLEVGKAHDIKWFTLQEIRQLQASGQCFEGTLELAELALNNKSF